MKQINHSQSPRVQAKWHLEPRAHRYEPPVFGFRPKPSEVSVSRTLNAMHKRAVFLEAATIAAMVLKLYGSRWSLNAKRVAIVLLEKQVKFEAIEIAMMIREHETAA